MGNGLVSELSMVSAESPEVHCKPTRQARWRSDVMKPILVILLTVVVGFVVGSLSVNEEIRIGVTVMGGWSCLRSRARRCGDSMPPLSGPDFPEVVTTLEKEVEGELCSGFTFKGDGGAFVLCRDTSRKRVSFTYSLNRQ